MKKMLGIVSLSSGFVSVATAIVLACCYIEDITKHVQAVSKRLFKNKRAR